MNENNRLSYIIITINKDLTVLPVGKFIITQINKLRRNDLFEGFNLIDLKKKKNMYILKWIKYKKVKK